MQNLHQIIGIGLTALTLTASYGCESTIKKQSSETAMAQTFRNARIALKTEPEPATDAIAAERPSTIKGPKPANNIVKIALLLDTSNSMDGLIDQAKAQLWDIVNKFSHAKYGKDARPELQIALYQYGNDELASREGYIQQVLNFSGDLDEISEKLFSLRTHGGEEFCGQVIHTSLKQLEWGDNPDHLKMIFIAGNEPFDQGRMQYRDAATDAKKKDVVVNTIFCGNREQGIDSYWKNGATLTGGEYMAIDHNRRIVHIDTPYDEVIIKLNKRLNSTYISYGSLGEVKFAQQSAQDNNAYEMEEAVAVKRAVSKSSRLYRNESWDLVDASEDAEFNATEIEKDDLPDELKDKSTAELEALIETKKSERARIQEEIREANAKREAFIIENQKENSTGELENAMLRAIVKQAELRGLDFE